MATCVICHIHSSMKRSLLIMVGVWQSDRSVCLVNGSAPMEGQVEVCRAFLHGTEGTSSLKGRDKAVHFL